MKAKRRSSPPQTVGAPRLRSVLQHQGLLHTADRAENAVISRENILAVLLKVGQPNCAEDIFAANRSTYV
ncbi:hypothetical protein KCP74_06435 [Salmonella enterica subsp. enterica]|nr:hypothetical protein KCP74_06435 [Salmonella enterica subsp. enterica]